MHFELMRDKSRTFPTVPDPGSFTTARIWHCSHKSLAALSEFKNLRELVIATFPDDSFAPLSMLTKLEKLSVLHLPNVNAVTHLAPLESLVSLELATLPSWDSSGKVTEVNSLSPLRLLPKLRRIALYGIVPRDRKVDDLIAIDSLREARLSKYPKSELQRLEDALATRAAG